MKSETVGIDLGQNFPTRAYDDANKRVWAKVGQCRTSMLFASAWNGVAWRLTGAREHSAALERSLRVHGGNPPAPERALEENALFGLYGTALSAIECCSFAAFVAGSIVDSSSFAITTDNDLKRINPAHTLKTFADAFPADPVLQALNAMSGTAAFAEIRDARNILSHRGAPGRTHNMHVQVGGPPAVPSPTIWNLTNHPLATGIGASRLQALEGMLAAGIEGLDAFTAAHL